MILSREQSSIPSKYFDFVDWEKAFDHFYTMLATWGTDMIQFVCSQHPYTSGYWIEAAGCTCSIGDDLIPTERVNELKEKIKAEINQARSEGRTPNFVTL